MKSKQNETKAFQIAQKMMLEKDAFSQWLGIQILSIRPGFCQLSMQLKHTMTNGFGIAHGGICYALADTALAFAANAHGRHAKSIETSIAHFHPVQLNDQLFARTEEHQISHKLGVYTIDIYNQNDQKVALFKGTVYRSSKAWTL